ncbi:hypothetical protein DICVIV_12371 [Dictyocaulus viviparus]|uniref:Kynureninase n=1 Tax=Dictyocaulus viviparus TaxID=29172 RepID=A0A0D8XCZ8_DICVI|nr:hypothetical protein DICVIV_12371 [Dictyocaulus viviparus]
MDKRERMLGWWSHRMETRFNMDNVILKVFKTVSLEDLRSKSCYLTGYLEFLIKQFLVETAERRSTKIFCSIITPQEFHERGCQLSLRFSVPIDIIHQELVKRGVAVDKRYPDVIRVTPVHLYNNYVDCHRFVIALIESCKIAETITND